MPQILSAAEIDRLLADAKTFRSRIVVRATCAEQDSTWTTRRGDQLSSATGDWWVTDGEERWSVEADVFTATYENVGGDRYRKVATVTAVQLDRTVSITTLEGTATGLAGDWLVCNPSGETWPVTGEVFTRRYEVA